MSSNISLSDQCYNRAVNPDMIWDDKSPLIEAVPTLVLQMVVSMTSNLIFYHLLQPLNQPRVVSDIIGGLVMHPSVVSKISEPFSRKLWPKRGMTLLETMANLGLLYLFFLRGLQMDTSLLSRRRKKTMKLTLLLIALPHLIGVGLYFFYSSYAMPLEKQHLRTWGTAKSIYWGAVISITSFPTITPLLARLKLLCTEFGREALAVGLVSDIFTWYFMFGVIVPSATNPDRTKTDLTPALIVVVGTIIFAAFCALAIRPLILWIIRRTPEGENYSDTTINAVLFLVIACGAVTEFYGAYSLVGAFIIGLCVPHGYLASTLTERMEDCVMGVLMPLFYALVANRFSVPKLIEQGSPYIIILAVCIKPFCGIMCSLVCDLSLHDGFTLGVLFGAKSAICLVIISIGLEREHIGGGSYSALLLIILFSSIIVGPIMSFTYKKKTKKHITYVQRTVEGIQADMDFRVLVCVHAQRNIPGILNLLEISNATVRSFTSVFVLHLVELLGRASAMLIVHDSADYQSSGDSERSGSSSTFFSRKRAQSDHIISAFYNFQEEHHGSTTVQTLTVVSALETMHEDICSLAEDYETAMILIPFHKQQGMDGKLEDGNVEFRPVNQNVMGSAPCSVGLLVDRGFGLLDLSPASENAPLSSVGASSRSSSNKSSRRANEARIAMVYVGGPDDREALTYAWRMARHQHVTLSVIRFLVGENAVEVEPLDFAGELDDSSGILTIMTQSEREREMDESFIAEFRKWTAEDERIEYVEKVANSGDETVAILRELKHHFDMYMVGRGHSVLSPLTLGLADWSECPELGPLGDVLVTSDFSSNASVLVVQQFTGARSAGGTVDNAQGIPEGATAIHF